MVLAASSGERAQPMEVHTQPEGQIVCRRHGLAREQIGFYRAWINRVRPHRRAAHPARQGKREHDVGEL